MLPEKNMKMITDALSASGLKVYTNDITENPKRPCFHLVQDSCSIQLHNQGTEVEMKTYYELNYFADKRYASALQMQMKLIEIFRGRISSEDYTIYPTEVAFDLFPDDGVLTAKFAVYNYHMIGSGSEESEAQVMSTLQHEENYN